MSITLAELIEKNPNFRPCESYSSIRKIERDTGVFGSLIGKRIYQSKGEKPTRNNVWLGRYLWNEATQEELFYLPEIGVYQLSMTEGVKLRPDFEYGLFRPQRCTFRYGNIWVYEELLKRTGFDSVINHIAPELNDTLNAFLVYKLTEPHEANYRGADWFDKSYARLRYPNAAMSANSISNFLKEIGQDCNYRKFFQLYLNYLTINKNINNYIQFPVLIDSTSLLNSKNIPFSALSRYNNDINKQIRLIHVSDNETKFPIYFHFIAGSIIDISTLKYIIQTLLSYNIKIKSVILDAADNSNNNLAFFESLDIDYISRLNEDRAEYKDIIKNYGIDIQHPEYLLEYQDKTIFCKKINLSSTEKKFFAYLCLDANLISSEMDTYRRNFFKYGETYDPNIEKFDSIAKFVLISNHEFENIQILQNYYQRQNINQNFDVAKNSAHLLPLRVHSEEAFRGYILVSFIQSIILSLIDNQLKTDKIDSLYVFKTMEGVYIDIYDNKSKILHALRKEEKSIVDALSLEPHYEIESSEYKNPYLREISNPRTRGRPLGRKNKQGFLQEISNTEEQDTLSGKEYPKENSIVQLSTECKVESVNTIDSNKRGKACLKGSKNKVPQATVIGADSINSSNKNDIKKRGRPKG
ncbi:MAG: transposase, partial [Clostridiales Family XIII bacterium]|nr:transposase [Clostridiales Family XIII bacterium]